MLSVVIFIGIRVGYKSLCLDASLRSLRRSNHPALIHTMQ